MIATDIATDITTDEARRRFLSPADVAMRLDCGYRTARQMMIDGALPVVMIGKRRRVWAPALERWIEQQTGQPTQVG